jgi:hypothetical protein
LMRSTRSWLGGRTRGDPPGSEGEAKKNLAEARPGEEPESALRCDSSYAVEDKR